MASQYELTTIDDNLYNLRKGEVFQYRGAVRVVLSAYYCKNENAHLTTLTMTGAGKGKEVRFDIGPTGNDGTIQKHKYCRRMITGKGY